MNWSKNSSIELSRICVVLFMILLAALDIGCYLSLIHISEPTRPY